MNQNTRISNVQIAIPASNAPDNEVCNLYMRIFSM